MTARNAAGAHALLNGWTAFYYLTSFEMEDGWCLVHPVHHTFRTANAKVIVRVSAPPEGAKEVSMGEVPESFFWALVHRITVLGLLGELPGIYPRLEGAGYDDRSDDGDDEGPPPAFRI